jgi:aryl-alcohol dehydrogenase-like predicted oxidoreductase
LGTAQLGMDYGINNTVGKPSISDALEMLETAFSNGIKILDTATAYGDSEKIIGEYMFSTNNYFKVATKLPKLSYATDLKNEVKNNIGRSLENLGIRSIDYYFFHSFKDFKDHPEILSILKSQQDRGKILEIGVSLYDTEELEYILDNEEKYINVVQIPFNIFDLRWKKKYLLERAKEKSIKIFTRSTYLQGLFFLNKQAAEKIHAKAYYYIDMLSQFAFQNNIRIDELAMQFIKLHNEIDYVLIGCETVNQLKSNLNNFAIDCSDKYQLFSEFALTNFSNIEKEIIDPRLWKR